MMNSLASYPVIIVILLYTRSPVSAFKRFCLQIYLSCKARIKKKKKNVLDFQACLSDFYQAFFFFFSPSDLQMLQKTHAWLVSSSGRVEEV